MAGNINLSKFPLQQKCWYRFNRFKDRLKDLLTLLFEYTKITTYSCDEIVIMYSCRWAGGIVSLKLFNINGYRDSHCTSKKSEPQPMVNFSLL